MHYIHEISHKNVHKILAKIILKICKNILTKIRQTILVFGSNFHENTKQSFVGNPSHCLHYVYAQQLAVQPVHLGNFVQPSFYEAY